jgi:hypothetical protein
VRQLLLTRHCQYVPSPDLTGPDQGLTERLLPSPVSGQIVPAGPLPPFRGKSGRAVLPLCYFVAMAVRKKRSISMPPELDAEIAAAAAQAGMSYSAWLADTARREFTIRAGLAAVSQFEQEHGAFSAAEMADADEWAARAIERAVPAGTPAPRRTA